MSFAHTHTQKTGSVIFSEDETLLDILEEVMCGVSTE